MDINQIYFGFKLLTREYIEEIDSNAYLFLHQKSGAKLYYLSNKDDNKVFSINFKTPPEDSTGLPHILEHAVLCGSRKFTVKDPFIELEKGSLNTFLNAMTYSDKTMYPIASRNNKDFMNLMDVYLDAVFYPNIYNDEDILKQEGWHYELEDKDSDIKYNGVVYNEMKGAFSSPNEILFRKIQESLYPNSQYKNESGGDPSEIVNLNQEEFLDFHRKYYHPSNGYIYLYGDGDVLEHLKFIDEEYLSDFSQKNIENNIIFEEPFKEEKLIESYYPILKETSDKNKTYLSLNFSVGISTDPEFYLAFNILNYVLIGSKASPIKNALLRADIGDDVLSSYDDSIYQHVFSIILKGSNRDKKDLFSEIIFTTLKDLVKNKIPEKLIEGAINSIEFHLREADYGRYPKGLAYGTKIMDSWLYGEHPSVHLRYNSILKQIRNKSKDGYFEDMIEKYLLKNKHRTLLILNPDKNLLDKKEEDIKNKLSDYKSKLKDEDIEKLINDTKSLKEKQAKPDSKSDLETIPQLEIEDISKDIEEIPTNILEFEGIKTLYHPMFTNEIIYNECIFDIRTIPQELIPYTSLFVKTLSKIDTENYSYEDLSNEVDIYTGGICFYLSNYVDYKNYKNYYPKLIIQGSSLKNNFNELLNLKGEIIQNTSFNNKKRLKEIIKEIKSRLEMIISTEGHMVGARHLASKFSESEHFMEITTGIGFYKFISDIEENFDDNYLDIVEKFKEISKRIFNKDNLVLNITADDESIDFIKLNINTLNNYLNNNKYNYNDYKFKLEKSNDGFLTSSEVQYVTKGYNFKDLGYEYSGHMQVMSTVISLDYLWNKVRIEGGAYGAMINLSSGGNAFLTSYRDPNLEKTIDVYDNVYKFIENVNLSKRELNKYIIGTISKMDFPLSPASKGQKAATYYFSNISSDDLLKNRLAVLSTTSEDINKLSNVLKDVMDKNYLCVIGNSNIINKNKNLFDKTENILK